MSPLEVASREYRRRKALIRRLVREASSLWRRLDRGDLSGSWRTVGPRVFALLYAAQVIAARDADAYLDRVLEAQGIDPRAAGALDDRALAGIASDGRSLGTLLDQPVIATKRAISRGYTEDRAMAVGEASLTQIIGTQIADAARVAAGMALVTRKNAGGYVRMLVPPSCSRCAVLAGKWFGWNKGFQRHPLCDCIHIPSRENLAGDLTTNPREYFDSLSKTDQDRLFTLDGAKAIRDGADISRVVNARRGMETAARAQGFAGGRLTTRRVFGRDAFTTTEAITKRGINREIRLMPEQIYIESRGVRDEAIRLLRLHGYIL